MTINGDIKTFDGSQWIGAGGSSYNVVIPTSSYTASDGEMVISDGYDVTLPSPSQNAIVGVSALSYISITAQSGSVETYNSVTLSSSETAQFASDGSNWYLITHRDAIYTTPDSAVRQWPFPERTNSTIVENLANDDGTVSGAPTNTADSQFYDGYYEATDGTDDAILLPVGEFEAQTQSKDFGLAFSLRTTNADLDTLGGASDSGFNENFLLTGSGTLEFIIGTGGNDVSIVSSTDLTDGVLRRVFLDVNTDDPANWELYLNDTSDSPSVGFNKTLDMSNINLSGAVNDIPFGARSVAGSLERFVSADIDHPILYSSPSRQDITDDYQLQPFA